MSTDGPFVGEYRCAPHSEEVPCRFCTNDRKVEEALGDFAVHRKFTQFKNALIEIAVYGSANPGHGFSCASMAKTALSQAGELGTYPLEKEKE